MKLTVERISGVVDDLAREMFSFISELVRSASLPGQEEACQRLVAGKLESLGMAVDIIPCDLPELKAHPAFCDDGFPLDTRFDVVGSWGQAMENRGQASEKKEYGLILNGHVDVVSPGDAALWNDSPWSGTIRDGKLVGRGSCDMKAGLSAGIFAIQALRVLGFTPRRGVCLQSVVGEESGGIGTLATIVAGYRARAAVIMEPTGLDICPVQSGALTFRIKVPGKSAHGCVKQFGVNAIEKFVPVLRALGELEARRHELAHHPLYNDSSSIAPLSVGTVRAGDWPSTVPEELVAEGRYGVFPGESIAEARKVFEDAVARAAQSDSWLAGHPPVVEWFEGQFESGATPLDDPLLARLRTAHQAVVGSRATLRGVTYGSDLRLFTNHASVPAVLYGPGSLLNAHAANEYVDLDEVVRCAKVLAMVIQEYCGGDE